MLLCGFAFDPHVAEDCLVVEKRAGKMRVLLVRMNPDLSMGDELLKKTGAATCSWSSASRTSSKKGKIAVKVINHYGDEVLKTYHV